MSMTGLFMDAFYVDVESLSANATVVIVFHCLQSHLRHHNGPVCATGAFVTLS